jgi:DnaK suppressor protein
MSAIRDSIDAERQQALARVEALKAELEGIILDSMDANADDEHDPEGSTVAFERAKVTALKSEAESHLAALERALERLGSGEYAVCERCRRKIPAERLAARPATTICVECARSPLNASGFSSS